MDNRTIHIDFILVTKLRVGDEASFEKLFEKYQNDIYIYALSLVKVKEYAQEILQDVFVQVWLKRATLKPELSFKSFVFTITKNRSFNFLVKASKEKRLQQEVFHYATIFHSQVDDYIINMEYELLRKMAVDNLPPKRRKIFEMSRIEGKSYKDISAELGITTQTVKNQMSKALSNITVYLKSYGGITMSIVFLTLLIH